MRADTRYAIVAGDRVSSDRGGSTVVPWWSFTKTIIAATTLTLVRDGLLDLDAALPPGYTARHLLRHEAGLRDYGDLEAYRQAVERREPAWPRAEVLLRARADEHLFAPGTGWQYSNIGYAIVRVLIETIAGEPLETAIATRVLEPLRLQGVRLLETVADARDSTGVAAGYDPRWVVHGLLAGPLGEAALLLERLFTSDLLPPALLQEMLDSHALGDDMVRARWRTANYGLGLMMGAAEGGIGAAGHSGAGPDSVVAVYRSSSAAPRTIAVFAPGDDIEAVERVALAYLAAANASGERR